MTTIGTPRRHLLALRPAAVFDGTSPRPLLHPTVLVDRGRIMAVDTSRTDLPDGATVVDLPACTLLPGPIDTHVHLAFDAGPDLIGHLAARDDETALAAMADAARRQLRAGVTTVRARRTTVADRSHACAVHVRVRTASAMIRPTCAKCWPGFA